jgi:transcriptional regulator with XRE-family HTH domain
LQFIYYFSGMKEVAATIKRLRELKGITRESMASELELSLSGYSKIERGETEISISKLYKISEILEVDVPKILNFDVSKVFNISNNNLVQGAGADEPHFHNQISQHTEKYIQMLESEVARLKSLLGEK